MAYCHSAADIAALKFSSDKKITSIFPIDESLAEVKYTQRNELRGYSKLVQPILYSYVFNFKK